MLLILEVGLLSAGLTLLLNYCIGKPGAEFSPYEIFSGYTVWLSKRRLKQIGLFDNYSKEYHENIVRASTIHERLTIQADFRRIIYNAAEPFFTWERMAGMCSVCTGLWVSLIGGLWFTRNLVYLLCIVVISHITIRILNKII